jgi:hypothetical protein
MGSPSDVCLYVSQVNPGKMTPEKDILSPEWDTYRLELSSFTLYSIGTDLAP